MPRTNITKQTASARTFPWSTAGLALTWTDADVANKNETAACSQMLILARNTGGSTRNVVVTSTADTRTGRTGNATATIAAGAQWMHLISRDGWQSATETFEFEGDHADVEFALIELVA